MKSFRRPVFIVAGITVACVPGLLASESVDINLNVRHSVGGVSEFDREKYIVLHAGLRDNDWDSDSQRASFLNDYDVYLGRNNGSLPWNLSQTTEDPGNAGWVNEANMISRGNTSKSNYGSDTAVHALEYRSNNMVIGGQEGMYPNGQTNGNGFALGGYEELGDYFEKYLTHFYGTGGTAGEAKPAMVEVMNEPFVKASALGTSRANMSAMHTNVANRIKASHPNVLVGGYSAAHPQYEGSDFGHWDANWKTFIDIAGTNMDFFALHLYDNPVGSTNVLDTMYRSGSNVEALLDMIEHYSMLTLGEVKPFNISEYGSLSVTNGAPYDPALDWVDVRSFSTIMMQLLERPDRMLQAIPFMILKAEWGRKNGYPYPTRLLYDVDELTGSPKDNDGPWAYTERLKFFELWKEVNGIRIDTIASDPDIQVDAYVDGTNAYVIVSSLDHTGPQTIDLNLFGTSVGLQQIEVKHSYAAPSGLPTLDSYSTNALSGITLGASATAVIKYTFDTPLPVDETSTESKYFATSYLQAIAASTPVVFSITNVAVSAVHGEAMLRLGIGRDHGKILTPTLLVNGSPVSVPSDWRGYDQLTRDQFFGVLEIPVPYAMLQSNNTVSVEFPDGGGHISSVSMQVFEFTADIRNSAINTWADVNGSDIIISFSNAALYSTFSLLSKTNLLTGPWDTNQADLLVEAGGFGSATNPITFPQEFYKVVLFGQTSAPPVMATVIQFTNPDYSDGGLDGQQNWNAEAGWSVSDSAGSGNAATTVNVDAAVLDEAIALSEGEMYSLSINFEFGGTYSTPTNFVYTFLAGLKENNTAAHVGTGNAVAADANIQIFSGSDSYRLLDDFDSISGASTIAGTELNAGDVLQFDYVLILGANAASTSYTVHLQNLTDGTDTGVGTVTGVDATLYSALTGTGAYGFFQSINPGAHTSGLSGVQVNSVTTLVSP